MLIPVERGTSSSRDPWKSLTGQSIPCFFVNIKCWFPSSINFWVITSGCSKYSELKDKLGNIGENKLLLITTIQLIDEYFDLKKRVTLQKEKLDEISNKFKQIKSLAIEYKKDKDVEIQSLHDELENLKKIIEKNNNLYESMLDKTAQSLEKIISNTESISKIQ